MESTSVALRFRSNLKVDPVGCLTNERPPLHLGDKCVLYGVDQHQAALPPNTHILCLVPVCWSHLWIKDGSDIQQNIKGDNCGLLHLYGAARLWL